MQLFRILKIYVKKLRGKYQRERNLTTQYNKKKIHRLFQHLTPKTQQEVLDLFNFEDTDFSQTDMQSGINWEKLTETNIN